MNITSVSWVAIKNSNNLVLPSINLTLEKEGESIVAVVIEDKETKEKIRIAKTGDYSKSLSVYQPEKIDTKEVFVVTGVNDEGETRSKSFEDLKEAENYQSALSEDYNFGVVTLDKKEVEIKKDPISNKEFDIPL